MLSLSLQLFLLYLYVAKYAGDVKLTRILRVTCYYAKYAYLGKQSQPSNTHFLTTEAMTIVHSGTVNDVAGKCA